MSFLAYKWSSYSISTRFCPFFKNVLVFTYHIPNCIRHLITYTYYPIKPCKSQRSRDHGKCHNQAADSSTWVYLCLFQSAGSKPLPATNGKVLLLQRNNNGVPSSEIVGNVRRIPIISGWVRKRAIAELRPPKFEIPRMTFRLSWY